MSRRRHQLGAVGNVLMLAGGVWLGWIILQRLRTSALAQPGTFNPASANNLVYRNVTSDDRSIPSDIIGWFARKLGGPDDTYNPNK